MMAADYPHRVRIIGGEWRRRWLDVPAGLAVRPTPDRVRETLFNWLAPRLIGARCLDLFAGSGVLGLEALSRGAATVTLIDHDPAVIAGLHHNATRVGASNARIVQSDAAHYLSNPVPASFHVVFVDPPFTSGLAIPTLTLLKPWLTTDGVVYLETPIESTDIPLPEGWRIMRDSTTRQTQYRLLEYAPMGAAD